MKQFCAEKKQVRERKISLKGVRNLPFKPFRIPKFFCWQNMVANFFGDFDPPSKKFLAKPLYTPANFVQWLSRKHLRMYLKY